jgi:RNA:NAD 2'-phosphotransferase (TPT1/KptA family)
MDTMSGHPKSTKQKDRKSHQQPSAKLRGNTRDDPKTRLSKTLSYVLRHGAEKEGIPIRPDGFALVDDLVGQSLAFTPHMPPVDIPSSLPALSLEN